MSKPSNLSNEAEADMASLALGRCPASIYRLPAPPTRHITNLRADELEPPKPPVPMSAKPFALAKPLASLAHCLICVELRTNGTIGLTDPPFQRSSAPATSLLSKQDRLMKSLEVRTDHLSWDEFAYFIQRQFGFELDFEKCEMGWLAASPMEGLKPRYMTVHSPNTFYNAVAVMLNASDRAETSSMLTFYLWRPIPPRETCAAAETAVTPPRNPTPSPPSSPSAIASPESPAGPAFRPTPTKGSAFDPSKLAKASERDETPRKENYPTFDEYDAAAREYQEYLRDRDSAR